MFEISQKETPKSPETLEETVGSQIFKNLIESGLAEQIINNSAHGQMQSSTEFYNSIEFNFEMGAGKFKNGILVVPRLKAKDPTQSVTLKLQRISRDEDEREVLVKKVWEGVSDEQKKALVGIAVDHLIARNVANLGSVESMRAGKVYEGAIKQLVNQWNQESKILTRLREALSKNTNLLELVNEIAALGVIPE